jgi:hypothetical protein
MLLGLYFESFVGLVAGYQGVAWKPVEVLTLAPILVLIEVPARPLVRVRSVALGREREKTEQEMVT